MTTIYQIGHNTYVGKDLIFGWSISHGDPRKFVPIDMLETTYLLNLAEVLSGSVVLKEPMEHVQKLLQDRKIQQPEPPVEKLTALKRPDLNSQLKRQADFDKLYNSVRQWFATNISPVKAFSFKTGDYVYARLIPTSCGYILLGADDTVVGEFANSHEAVSAVMRRWW